MCIALFDFIELVFKVGCVIPFCLQELFHFGTPVIVERNYVVAEVIEDLVDSAGSVADDGGFEGFDPCFVNCIDEFLHECSFNAEEHFLVIDFDFVGGFPALALGLIGLSSDDGGVCRRFVGVIVDEGMVSCDKAIIVLRCDSCKVAVLVAFMD